MPKKAMEVLTESMFYLLMALSDGAKCGIDAADFVERVTAGRVRIGPATLYTVLAKFEKERYIKEIEEDGRRRTYEITQKGMDAYSAEIVRLRRCICDAERVSEDNGGE